MKKPYSSKDTTPDYKVFFTREGKIINKVC